MTEHDLTSECTTNNDTSKDTTTDEIHMDLDSTRPDPPVASPAKSAPPPTPTKPPIVKTAKARLEWAKRLDLSFQSRSPSADPTATSSDLMDLDGDSDGDEAGYSSKTKGKQPAKKKPSGSKYTPLEEQFVELRKKHPDVLLIIEVGYKFRFFDEDARTASKHLGIVAYLDHNFLTCSIPTHRLPVHVKKLVHAGYKVGVVRQMETAALKKAGDNRNTPFVRKLTNLYTTSTLVDDLGLSELNPSAETADAGVDLQPVAGFLVCLCEDTASAAAAGKGTASGVLDREKVKVGIVGVQLATGDVVFDEFEDNGVRNELSTRLLHLQPAEILLPSDPLTDATEKLVKDYAKRSIAVNGGEDASRVERLKDPVWRRNRAKDYLAQFYTSSDTSSPTSTLLMGAASSLPDTVLICLAALLRYLEDFGLRHVFKTTESFRKFTERVEICLNANTLHNLEIFRTQEGTEKGSLFSLMDNTVTGFGKRMLRKWVGKPLKDKTALQLRIDAVEELVSGEFGSSDFVCGIVVALKRAPDLERGVARIQYGRCSPAELFATLVSFQTLAEEFSPSDGNAGSVYSPLIRGILDTVPKIAGVVEPFLDDIVGKAALANNKEDLFKEGGEREERWTAVKAEKDSISMVEFELDEHLKEIKKKLKRPDLQYVTVSQIDYLIEIRNNLLSSVPSSWIKLSSTKSVSRFHTPFIVEKMQERERHKELLKAEADKAYKGFLEDIASVGGEMRTCVEKIGTFDCLVSLATVAQQTGYTKPEFVDAAVIEVVQGRHPMVEAVVSNYVPNDIHLTGEERCLVVTGPNMGGKSCYIREVALISIMAQIGSYVPAESARLGLVDAIFTRMGASDNIQKGQSTFMTELVETSEILQLATERSLVILDELGRGTSTHDGQAIAIATLSHLVLSVRSLTLFVTHYPSVGSLEKQHPRIVRNAHMGYLEAENEEVVFLYKLTPGLAHRSYGLNVARLAGLPKSVLESAEKMSSEMEHDVEGRKAIVLCKAFAKLLCGGQCTQEVLERLRSMIS
ncbi:Mismatch repair protein msh3 [Gonapodya sp. JEL0774]|nr:Mismatch repair protein msh3 [Gonapodya sp. JEL0774]